MATQVLRRVARSAGISEGALRSELPERLGIPSFIQPDLVRHWERVLGRSRRLLASLAVPAGPRVGLITTVAKGYNTAGYTAILAYALRLRGADPYIVYCDAALDGCERVTVLHMPPEQFTREGPAQVCPSCYPAAERLYRTLGLPVFRLSEFLGTEAYDRAERFLGALAPADYYQFSYRGLSLGPQVEATVARFLFSHAPTLEPPARGIAQRCARGAVLMAEAMLAMHERLSPEVVFHNFGAYVSRGTAWLVAQAAGARSIVWSRAESDGALMIGEGANPVIELADRTTGPWETLELTPERSTRLDERLDVNIQGSLGRAMNRNMIDDRRRILDELRLDQTRPVVTLFTNCGFDSKLFYDTALYPDVLAWVSDTIELFRGRREQLVIRVHPYESWIKEIEQTAGRIVARFPVLPENARLVPAEHKLNSYVLSGLSQAVIVYGSQIGVELAAAGKPVIVAGRGTYWRKGFTYDVHSREEYAAILAQLEAIARPDAARTLMARRFAYYYYFMRQMEFAYWNHDLRPDVRLSPWWKRFRRLEDLLPGRNADLDAICAQVLDGREALAAGV